MEVEDTNPSQLDPAQMDTDDNANPPSFLAQLHAFLDPARTESFIGEQRGSLAPFLAHLAINNGDAVLGEELFPALGKCLKFFPQLWQFSRALLSPEHPPFARLLKGCEPPPKKKAKKSDKKVTAVVSDEALLEACVHFLNADPFFHDFWPWSRLHEVVKSLHSPKCLWLATNCLGLVFGLGPEQKLKLCAGKVTRDEFLLISAEYLSQSSVLPVTKSTGDTLVSSENVVNIADVCLPKRTSPQSTSDFIELPEITKRLREAALAVSSGRALLLKGPIACGKTRLVEHLVHLTGRKEFQDFNRLQITDQTDGRSLLGGYVCSRVPGRFVWKSGPLTEAVAKGRWLLIEDIDQAGLDVMATLLPLLESGRLYLPSKGANIVASPGFQLFFTMKSSAKVQQQMAQNGEGMILAGKVGVIEFEKMSEEDLITVATAKFPDMATILPKVSQFLHQF